MSFFRQGLRQITSRPHARSGETYRYAFTRFSEVFDLLLITLKFDDGIYLMMHVDFGRHDLLPVDFI